MTDWPETAAGPWMRDSVSAGTACCAPTEFIWAAQVVWERSEV